MSVTQTVIREFEIDLVVLEAEEVARDVVALQLGRPDAEPLPEWTPGAHIDVILGDDLVRQYSLCGPISDADSWRIAVLRAPDTRGGSKAVHDLRQGSTVRVRGPRNHFPVVSAKRYIFVAGGIGITPLLAMIAEVEAAGAEWELHYGGRSLDSMAFVDELRSLGDRVRIVPQDERGLLDLDVILGRPDPDALVYACGPEPLLAALEERCRDWPTGALHLERFAARASDDAAVDEPFELVLQRSGRTLEVPTDRSVFEVVRQAGVSVLGSCLEGICGTCEVEVLEGKIDHRDSVLDDDEREAGDVMMVCVSRCRSGRLVLDL